MDAERFDSEVRRMRLICGEGMPMDVGVLEEELSGE